MATKPFTVKNPMQDSAVYTWAGLANGDDGEPVGAIGTGDRTIQITNGSTFGVGGTVIVEGSLNGTDWFQLRDPSSTLISFTAASGKAILENAPFVRARVTGGDGTTALTALLSVRR